ncbi:MAG: hypothetical protein IT158_27415 [Bryobacterales bacterium]|nr:hypothetical protein [Bryobacterales bacterium]
MNGPLLALCLALPLAAADIAVVWSGGSPEGEVRVTGGRVASLSPGTGVRFRAGAGGPFRLRISAEGGDRAILHVAARKDPFSFFLRDVSRDNPIYLPAFGAAVTVGDDPRSFAEIEAAVRARGLQTKLQAVESEPEESYDNAARHTRPLSCQTWLGVSRDVRIFALGERLDWVQTRFHGADVARYSFLLGRGWGPSDRISRRLEEGVLPIVHGTLVDDDVAYTLVAFAALESRPLTAANLRGTHFLVADGHGRGHMFTKEQQALHDSLLPAEMNQPEETVLYLRAVAVNTAAVPRYAFFRNLALPAGSFDAQNGFGLDKSGKVFAVSKLNGRPLNTEEVSLLLPPGGSAELEMYLPHRPVPVDRAAALRSVRFDQRREECRRFWKAKLDSAARIEVPERRIDEMIRAGLLHLDLITYGREPEGTLTSTIGVYSAIGSESSPIIQFMDGMRRHDVARRALQYFLDKQHDDGFIQNFGGYMLETGAALWSLGEHYRYTRDDEWVRRIAPRLIKACEYLSAWRRRNLREDLRGKGYGMLDGKTADPEDPFRSYMLNGYAYLGLNRVSEMLRGVDEAQSRRWAGEAQALKKDIRTAVQEGLAQSPVIPLADGAWCPTLAPWTGYHGPLLLHGGGGKWFTHGAMVSRDSLLGPLYLVFQEVLEPGEPASSFLLNFHNDLMTSRNVAFTQPYYSRHPIVHLRRGEVRSFLKSYYNTAASLADRETYTFWEHFFGASPHKTHEEGWFLMDTRWMLWMERGDTLDLLAGIPRAWLEDGRRIALDRVASYFGPVSLKVESRLSEGRIEAVVECSSPRRPKAVELRLPHPLGRKAETVEGGSYDPVTERVRIAPFEGQSRITLRFRTRT